MTDSSRAPRNTALLSLVSTNSHVLLTLILGLGCGSLLCQLLLLLLLLDYVRVVVECLIKFELLHLFAILYFLVLWNAIARELLAEEIVVGELIGPLLVLLHFWLERGLHLVRSLSRVLWILVHQRVTLNERLR